MAQPTPLDTLQSRLEVLQTENARLIALLDSHGIEWGECLEPQPQVQVPVSSGFSTTQKVALFRRLFRGRTDVYPVRWESKTTGKSGYSPACGNEWRLGICAKPRVKCADCVNRLLIPVSDEVIYRHLAGDHTVGIYPLLEDDRCHFLAVDFDEEEWREDARAFIQSCDELGVPVALETSRSGEGAHAWIFFLEKVAARDARNCYATMVSVAIFATNAMRVRLWMSDSRGYCGQTRRRPLWRCWSGIWAFYALRRLSVRRSSPLP
jgi:hypothetical protein